MQPLHHSILKTLAYFDMFAYPLLAEEITVFLDHTAGADEVSSAICKLVNMGSIFQTGPFYSLRNNASLATRRKEGNKKALALLKTAKKIGALLYRFPFVRGVGISGSLSKNFAGEDADIDFFIITAANRLWIARTFMHLLKKISFLSGRQHWFCMNYYISEEALVIEEKNIFTATEVVTLIPVCGNEIFEKFFTANNWASNFYPAHPFMNSTFLLSERNSLIKRLAEKIFSAGFGDRLDKRWMKLTTKRWLRKQEHHRMNNKGEPMGLKTSRHTARPAPENFQKKILDAYAAKLSAFSLK